MVEMMEPSCAILILTLPISEAESVAVQNTAEVIRESQVFLCNYADATAHKW